MIDQLCARPWIYVRCLSPPDFCIRRLLATAALRPCIVQHEASGQLMALAAFAPYRLAMEECGSALLDYATLHNAVTGMRSSHTLRKPEHVSASLRGVLVVKPEHGGMGNVLRIIGQYALLGVLLRRVVCLELDYQDPRFPSADSMHAQIHPYAHSPVLDWRCLGVPMRSSTAHVIHVTKRNNSGLLNYFGSIDLEKDLSAFELVRIHADSTRVEQVLLSNPFLRAKQLVPRGRSAGACVRQLLLQPTKQTLDALSLYLNRLPFPRPYAAAHIRLGDSQMAGLGGAADLRVRPTHHNKLFQCVLARLMGSSEQSNASTYFVATDNAEIVPELLQRSRMRAVFVPGTPVHTGAWAQVHSYRSNNVQGLQKVWLDHFLLSLGNGQLVSSGGRLSSFAEEAAARHTRFRGIIRCR